MPADPKTDAPPLPLPLSVRVLQWLVIAMTVTMIAGVITVVVVLVTRLPRLEPYPALPEALALPAGVQAEAITFARGAVLVVTRDGRLLVLDRETGALVRTIAFDPIPPGAIPPGAIPPAPEPAPEPAPGPATRPAP